jgi:glycerol-3-phosphate dehydrogenase (NAD(P)+)
MAEAIERVLILGHGAMGRMFETLLSGRCELAVWDRDPDSGEETAPLEGLAGDRELVIFALPAHPHDELARRLARILWASQ